MWSGKCPFGEMSQWGNVQSGKCPVGELSVRGNVRRGSVSRGIVLGEVSVGELSSRGTVRIPVCMVHLVDHKLCLEKILLGMTLLRYFFCLNLLSKSPSTILSQCRLSIKTSNFIFNAREITSFYIDATFDRIGLQALLKGLLNFLFLYYLSQNHQMYICPQYLGNVKVMSFQSVLST